MKLRDWWSKLGGGVKVCALVSASGTRMESACRRDHALLQWSRHEAP